MGPLSRLATDLRAMRWAQVAVELLLLVVGILIALAVDGWVDDRRDARTERQYLELLQRDLDRDTQILDEFIAFEERQVADGVLAYRALADEVPVAEREAVGRALVHLQTRRTLRLTRAAYADLISTGNLRLIRDRALRDRIITLYETNDRFSTIIDRNNQVFVDQMYALALIGGGLIEQRATSNLAPFDETMTELAGKVAVPVGTAGDGLWQFAPRDPEWRSLRNKVWMRAVVSQQAIRQATAMREQTVAVREALATELARP